ncbi:MAG: signal peptidase I [Candidatus Tagabacteria bacterium RIFCSPLOWO2_01_FULL_39_11]|uniref:Signal peptidase I n=1 Tax=Candidatus Tagabacteria bacterium RIFCSPLOWO2_01_FULL_39_11 TaxID=1802295 RepID=A0A1G2LR44_9BACT|nr:MAG: signal peptidase I [Candidatus Tagabacteria bacterium RIFCSPLOWO2_01_FULL_39_11]
MNGRKEEIREEESEKKSQSRFAAGFKEIVKFVAISLLIIVPFRMWVAQPFVVSGASMEPNFLNGDYLIVDELTYNFREPKRGEIIIFKFPQNTSQFFIKRIVGLPKETVEITPDGVYIYNEEKPEGFLLGERYLYGIKTQSEKRVEIDENEYFVLGDNRLQSFDSRNWGALGSDYIVGRAWLRLWPINKIGFVEWFK